MSNLITRIIGDKREWKAMEARANALPRDYRIAYGEIKPYLWKFTTGNGTDIIAALNEVLALFETGAAQGKNVLDVTGEDIAAFCDERRHGSSSSYLDRWRTSLNRDLAHKLAE
jgi:DNA-binding ferritin-like protein (Dps family)